MIEFETGSADATFDLGRILGTLLVPGDFIALVGDLGAGKTQFVKGMARGVGVPDDETVCSPSYTILNIHSGRVPFYHFDLYRLGDEGEVDDLGFDEYFSGNGVCAVEWAERMGGRIPGDNLTVFFRIDGPESRILSFRPTGDRAVGLLRRLREISPYKSV